MNMDRSENWVAKDRLKSERPRREKIIREVILKAKSPDGVVKRIELRLRGAELFVNPQLAHQWAFYYTEVLFEEKRIKWKLKRTRTRCEDTKSVPGFLAFNGSGKVGV